jgi:hypothetical protein
MFGCCGGLGYWGIQLNKQEARRDYDAAEELWSAGNRAEAVEKYRNIKTQWLGDAEKEVVQQRIREFDEEQTKTALAAAHKLWASGQKTEAAVKYRTLKLDLLEVAERDTVRQRIREVDLAKAKKDLAEADRLWTSGQKSKAVVAYNDIPLDLLDAESQKLVTRRLYQAANDDWAADRKPEAAAAYKRLKLELLTQTERTTIEQRIEESDAREKKFNGASRTRHGKKVELDHVDLYYTSAISVAEAWKLGDYLDRKYKDLDRRISVQITKEGKTYQYRMVVKKGIDRDEEHIPGFKAEALLLSLLVFKGADVEVHLCDDQLNTLRVVIPVKKG